jgi:glucan endo-1,3-beta-D-glucosidase
VASVENTKTYWDELGCQLFNKYNVWWYILRDNNGSPAPDPSFGIVGLELEEPLFDLTCPAGSSGAGETASSGTASAEVSAETAPAETASSETASSGTPKDDVAASTESAADGAADVADDEDCEE